MLQIITDSASDITLQQAQQMNIHIVPINIQFADGPCPQETEEDFVTFYKRLTESEELPVTSQPSPETYLQYFETAKQAGDEVLVLTLSSGLSGTINAVKIAKEMCEYEAIFIVDSRQAIVAQRVLVEYAVKLRLEGMDTQTLIGKVEALRDRITVSGVIDTLTYLRKGGRIPASLAILGNTLQIKPVIALEDTILKTVGKALGMLPVSDICTAALNGMRRTLLYPSISFIPLTEKWERGLWKRPSKNMICKTTVQSCFP